MAGGSLTFAHLLSFQVCYADPPPTAAVASQTASAGTKTLIERASLVMDFLKKATHGQPSFRILVPNTETLSLAASSVEAAKEWISALEDSIEYANNQGAESPLKKAAARTSKGGRPQLYDGGHIIPHSNRLQLVDRMAISPDHLRMTGLRTQQYYSQPAADQLGGIKQKMYIDHSANPFRKASPSMQQYYLQPGADQLDGITERMNMDLSADLFRTASPSTLQYGISQRMNMDLSADLFRTASLSTQQYYPQLPAGDQLDGIMEQRYMDHSSDPFRRAGLSTQEYYSQPAAYQLDGTTQRMFRDNALHNQPCRGAESYTDMPGQEKTKYRESCARENATLRGKECGTKQGSMQHVNGPSRGSGLHNDRVLLARSTGSLDAGGSANECAAPNIASCGFVPSQPDVNGRRSLGGVTRGDYSSQGGWPYLEPSYQGSSLYMEPQILPSANTLNMEHPNAGTQFTRPMDSYSDPLVTLPSPLNRTFRGTPRRIIHGSPERGHACLPSASYQRSPPSDNYESDVNGGVSNLSPSHCTQLNNDGRDMTIRGFYTTPQGIFFSHTGLPLYTNSSDPNRAARGPWPSMMK